MTGNIPEMMLAAFQEAPGGPLILKKVAVPKPGKGEVLVKMAAAPINPSDLSMLQGTYATTPQYPVVPGLEGSGLVIAAGNGLMPWLRNGKKVACSSSPGHGGTWAEYMITSAMHVIPIGNIPFIAGSMAIVNPLTALAFLNIARQGKHRAVVNNAAASALGKMLVRLFNRYNINLVNIVRTDQQAGMVKEAGGIHILNSSDDGFSEKLASITEKLGATLFFDALGGDHTNILLNASPAGSRIILYANLSESDFSAEPRAIIQKGRIIEGFFLGNYTGRRGIISTLADISSVKRMIRDELSTNVSGRYPLENINDALADYRSGMSKGKVIITPDPVMAGP